MSQFLFARQAGLTMPKSMCIVLIFYYFCVSGFILGFLGFLKLMCLYIEVPKNDVNTFVSYYMHSYYLREDPLSSWVRTSLFWV